MDEQQQSASAFAEIQIQLSKEIAQRVETLLKDRHMSQREFARAMGKTETEVSRWLSGRHNLTLATIAKMAAVLHDDIITTTRTPRRYPLIEPTHSIAAERTPANPKKAKETKQEG